MLINAYSVYFCLPQVTIQVRCRPSMAAANLYCSRILSINRCTRFPPTLSVNLARDSHCVRWRDALDICSMNSWSWSGITETNHNPVKYDKWCNNIIVAVFKTQLPKQLHAIEECSKLVKCMFQFRCCIVGVKIHKLNTP